MIFVRFAPPDARSEAAIILSADCPQQEGDATPANATGRMQSAKRIGSRETLAIGVTPILSFSVLEDTKKCSAVFHTRDLLASARRTQ